MPFPELDDIPSTAWSHRHDHHTDEWAHEERPLSEGKRRQELWKRRVEWFLDEDNTPTAAQSLTVLRHVVRVLVGLM